MKNERNILFFLLKYCLFDDFLNKYMGTMLARPGALYFSVLFFPLHSLCLPCSPGLFLSFSFQIAGDVLKGDDDTWEDDLNL